LAGCGRYGEGLAALREAAELVEETGERYVEAASRVIHLLPDILRARIFAIACGYEGSQ
jgi:hypothetical protein